MIGIEERVTDSGIRVTRLHYTAHEPKRDPAWIAQARQGFVSEREWRREMEIDWSVSSGLPVYAEEFVRDWHVAKEPLAPIPGLPIYRGWDFGLQPCCVFGQVDPMGRLNGLEEYVTWDGRGEMKQAGIMQACEAVVMLSNRWFPGYTFIDYADPAGWAKAQTDEKSCVEVMNSNRFKIYPRPGAVTFTQRRKAVEDRLHGQRGGRAMMLLSPNCRMLVEGFDGAYKFEQIGETGRYKETVEKNAWSHPMNGWEYLVTGIYAPRQKERDPDDWRDKRQSRRFDQTGY